VPCESVSISTSARLHFGFLDPSGRGPTPFGSFGLAIDRPQTRLSLRRGNASKVSGVECERAAPYLRAITASLGLAAPYHLHLDEVISAHAGLGSGTQLALAIGSAVAVLEGLPLDLTGIAARLERGKRSGIGIGTFEQGGAVLDGGPSNGALPEVLWRVPFPRDWRVLLIFDPAETGVHGANEIAAFAALPAAWGYRFRQRRRALVLLHRPVLDRRVVGHGKRAGIGLVGIVDDLHRHALLIARHDDEVHIEVVLERLVRADRCDDARGVRVHG